MILNQDNYFELLGIDENATEREIRLAYTKMLRTYPHEQFPEEFQLFLKAKDTLLDPELREKHIKSIKDDGFYDLLVEKTIKYYNEKNYKSAYDAVKRLLIETNEQDSEVLKMASTITGELGYEKEQEKYIQALERNYASSIDVKRYLGNYYYSQKRYVKAITYAEQVIELDSSDLNEIIFLIDLYRLNGQNEKAKVFIKSNLNKDLKLHDYSIIENGLVIAANTDDRAFAKEMVKKLKVLATGSNKEEILRFIVNTTNEIDENKYIFKFFILLVEEINNYEFSKYTEWVQKAKPYIKTELNYFELEEKQYSRPHSSSKPISKANTSASNRSYEKVKSSNTEIEERSKLRGTLLWAIIFGIIAWAGNESFGTGIVVGVVWYFLGGLIKGLIGCLVLIVIIIIIIAMFMG